MSRLPCKHSRSCHRTPRAEVAAWYDAYLNSFYRSLKAWLRRDIFGARLHAAESAPHLLRTLFSLEQCWTPYYDRLQSRWAVLSGQGWQDGELEAALLALVDSGDPGVQIELETRVEVLLQARDFGHVLAGWDGAIAEVKAWSETKSEALASIRVLNEISRDASGA
jgi:hypothetical protein